MEKWSTCARFPCDPKEGDVKPEEVTKASFSKLDAAGFEPPSRKKHLIDPYCGHVFFELG